MSNNDEQTLRLLVQHVARGFYDPKFIIILDQLSRHRVLKDDELAGRTGLQLKELNKLMAVLVNHRLVHVHRQNELKEGAQRSVGRQYYYIDYKHFCDVVKWRVAEMRRIIDSGLRNELDSKGYICPQCGKSYTPLDVDKLFNLNLGTFVCEICGAEVVDNENAETVERKQDQMQRFNMQMQSIIEGLRKTEAMVIPAFDVPSWIKSHTMDAEKPKAGQPSALKVAGSSSGSRQDEGVGIVMSIDKDEATRRQERDAEAAAKRQQNALPTWHLKSTITGDLTALGIQENARSMTANGNVILPSNDDTLKGLGTVGPPLPLVTPVAVEDIKPEIRESDYYDQYYASLAASNAASAQATPSAFASEELGDDEHSNPPFQYLDSLNAYQKRSRSVQDDGTAVKKIVKVDSEPPDVHMQQTEPEVPGMTGADDPVVFVNGAPRPFSQVTEEDQELMTPDEYTTYFEVFQAQS